ncbi:Dual specificity protein phosphatase [Planctopirus limnophila DSM 3776]|uniref:Dual specificity protein phosphatase n=2 Tax=Planctopirus limnophila TaxID=120 RepID=D5SXC1_PLAL2|nr:Dual specificity protein phosphatase [Planctopirus limnophila DSM 3776]
MVLVEILIFPGVVIETGRRRPALWEQTALARLWQYRVRFSGTLTPVADFVKAAVRSQGVVEAMNQIEPHPIWIGHAGDGQAFRAIFDAGIRAIVQLSVEEPPIQPPRELIYQRYPLLDGEGNDRTMLRLAIDAVKGLIMAGIPTLVCCGAGMSRSPIISAAALSVAYQIDFEDALQKVLEHRPADISPALLHEIRATLIGEH